MPSDFDMFNNTNNSTTASISSSMPPWAFVAFPLIGAVMAAGMISYFFSKMFCPRRPQVESELTSREHNGVHSVAVRTTDLEGEGENREESTEEQEEQQERDIEVSRALVFSPIRHLSFGSTSNSPVEGELHNQVSGGLQTPSRSMSI